MQRSTESLENNGRHEPSLKVELPERSSTYVPHEKTSVSTPNNRISSPGLESVKDPDDKNCGSPGTSPHNRISSPGLESIKDLANKEYGSPVSPHNEVSSPGLESIKDIVDKEGHDLNAERTEKEFYTPFHTAPEVHEQPIRSRRKRNRLLIGALLLFICIAVGLGVGLGVGLTRNTGLFSSEIGRHRLCIANENQIKVQR